jgi:putative glycosyltransferase (TIGR04348 family)
MAPTVILVTPYLADANNGNWRTAARWARLLSPGFRTILQVPETPVTGGRRDTAVAMIALHARRSRTAIAAWKATRPDRPLIVVMTGTDLYRDVPAGTADACQSLADAHRLIVLQPDALPHLPEPVRDKVDVVYQSARALSPVPRKAADRLHCLLVAHLRDEKDPRTVFEAWRRLPLELPATLSIIGAALDPALGDAARSLAADDRRVQVLGARPHAWTRQAIKRAHLLIVPSRMEGGANVVVEAVTSGTPVLASRISGNLGMLGADYPGYFGVGDSAGVARLIEHAFREPAFLATLQAACAARAPSFTPASERAALVAAIERALAGAAGRMTAHTTGSLSP